MIYRLYFLDDGDAIIAALDMTCDDDAKAVVAARARSGGHAVELWQGVRLVAALRRVCADAGRLVDIRPTGAA